MYHTPFLISKQTYPTTAACAVICQVYQCWHWYQRCC